MVLLRGGGLGTHLYLWNYFFTGLLKNPELVEGFFSNPVLAKHRHNAPRNFRNFFESRNALRYLNLKFRNLKEIYESLLSFCPVSVIKQFYRFGNGEIREHQQKYPSQMSRRRRDESEDFLSESRIGKADGQN